MKSIQKYRALVILVIAFVFFNTFVMSDSGWVDENENIYSHVDGNVGIGTDNPDEKVVINTDDTTADYPVINDRGDVDLKIERQNQCIEIGTAGGTNTRKSWILARHSSTSTYGKFYSSLHLQPDVGDKTCYKGVAIGYEASIAVPVGTHLMVNGNVGIGTTSPDEKLTVDGKIHAREIIVDTDIADFVFEDDYQLASLSEVEEFIEKEGHLPEIPCTAEVEENGVSLGEMNTKLLQKIEELTLYIIEQDKRIAELEKKVLSSE